MSHAARPSLQRAQAKWRQSHGRAGSRRCREPGPMTDVRQGYHVPRMRCGVVAGEGQGCTRRGRGGGSEGGGGGGGFDWDTPPPWVSLWSLPKAGRKCSSVNPLGAEGAEAKFGCQPQTLEEEEGGSRGGGVLLRRTAVRIHPWGRGMRVGSSGQVRCCQPPPSVSTLSSV